MATRQVCGLILMPSLALSASLAIAQTQDDITACVAVPHLEGCFRVIRYEYVKNYEQPDTSSRVLWTGQWGREALIDWPRARNSPLGWLPINAPDWQRPNLPSGGGWVEIKNLAGLADFRRVVGCWPVSSLKFELGDYAFHVTFTPQGRASISEGRRSHVQFTPNLILIRSPDGPNIFGFEQETRRLFFPDPNDLERNSPGEEQ